MTGMQVFLYKTAGIIYIMENPHNKEPFYECQKYHRCCGTALAYIDLC